MYNFDEIINRKGTNSEKYDFTADHGKPEDALSMWVADMDFRIPDGVRERLKEAAEHGIFGYTGIKEDYYDAVINWFATYFAWNPKKEWMVNTPGVVYAIATAIRAFTEKGDSIIIQQPVYYPFANMIRKNKRNLVINSLLYENGSYRMDYQDFEKKVVEHRVKMFILCSPHNPVGRVWTKAELLKIGKICRKHQVLVVSDEIHCDFTYPGHTHTIYAALGEDYARQSVICTAPSKTFNLAGLQASNIWISDQKLRKKFKEELVCEGYFGLNTMAVFACQAAYEHGEEWLMELRDYLKGNLDFIREFLEKNIPKIKLVEPEGTYLVWLDCRGLGMSKEELETFMLDKAKLWLDGGTMFGKEGSQFQRVNIACPRSVIEKAMTQLETAVRTAEEEI